MRIMVIYGTTQGHTRRISNLVAAKIKGLSHDVELLDSGRDFFVHNIASFDAVIIVGSVHHGRYQKTILDFTIAHLDELQRLPTMFVSVSLSSAFQDGEAAAQSYVDDFINQTGLNPVKVSKAADKMQPDHFDYFIEKISDLTVFRNLRQIEGARDFTNWVRIEEEVLDFIDFLTRAFLVPNGYARSTLMHGGSERPGQVSNAGLKSVISETITLTCGERIYFNMMDLLGEYVTDATRFISIDIPDWLHLNGGTGEISGEIPEYSENRHPVKFVVYTAVGSEISAKATLTLECCNKTAKSEIGSPTCEFSEGSTVILGTAKLFADSGWDIDSYQFEASGLPSGLKINSNNGVIAGTIQNGAASETPYDVVVSAKEKKRKSYGVSVKLFFVVGDGNPVRFHVPEITRA